MDCVVVSKREWIWYLIGPLLGLAAVAVAVVWLVLTYRARLLEAWETRHILALKSRSATHLSWYLVQHPSVSWNSKLGFMCYHRQKQEYIDIQVKSQWLCAS